MNVVLLSRGERLLFEIFRAEGIKEEAAALRARQLVEGLFRRRARVFTWGEVMVFMIFISAVALILGFLGGVAVGVVR